jgi:integrase
MPFKRAAAIVHAQHEKSWKNHKHAKQWINTLEQYAFPALGDTSVELIRSQHVVAALAPIWLIKCETARRVLQRIGTVLLWAKGSGYRSDSPTDEIRAARKALPRQNAQKGHHKALPYTGLPTFIERLRASGASESVKLAFEFLILTAARTNEVLNATWPEVDFTNNVWTIPASRMKAKREHQVPLTERCVAILKIARMLNPDPLGYLFPAATRSRPLSTMAFLMLLRRMAIDTTAHGFRSTFRVWCAEQTNIAREVAEAALAHAVKDATEAAYMRSTFFEKRRRLMEAWARYVAYSSGIANSDHAVFAD